MSKDEYSQPYGLWRVTTEGDAEGRTIQDLKFHEGFLDEIALALAPKSYYSLRFSRVIPSQGKATPLAAGVEVSLDIDSNTWTMSPVERVAFFENLLRGRPVSVKPGQYYASVALVCGRTKEERDRLLHENTRKTALAKLTPHEREALGIK